MSAGSSGTRLIHSHDSLRRRAQSTEVSTSGVKASSRATVRPRRLDCKPQRAEAKSDRFKICAASEVLDNLSTKQAPPAVDFQGIPQMWGGLAESVGDSLAVLDPHHSPAVKLTFRELNSFIRQCAAGFSKLGLKQGDRVALFSENSARWLIADQAIMTLGAADAVRGSTSPPEEMVYIIQHSGSQGLIVQDLPTLERALPALTRQPSANGSASNGSAAAQGPLHTRLKFVVLLWGEPSDKAASSLDCPLLSFNQVLGSAGRTSFEPPPIRGDDLATLVYTSGTTGAPKGVELTHSNLDYQRRNLSYYLPVTSGDRTLSLLPPWHIYERSCGYYIFSCGGCQVYTSIRNFKEDLTKYPPEHFVCVPLVLDTLYNRIRQQIKRGSKLKRALARFFLAASRAFVRARRVVAGLALQHAVQGRSLLALVRAAIVAALLLPLHRLGQALVYKKIRQAIGIKKTVVSGGGSLAPHLDDFFEVLGLEVLNGWGLTENVRGSVGFAMPGTELRVVHPDTLEAVEDGQQGLLLARGPGVMRGYHADAESTRAAMRAGPGWFDTGDLGWRAPAGVAGSRMAGAIALTGRSKDTIVLSNGENIEPQPIEDACCQSAFISHLILVGQGKRVLGALVAPNADAFSELESVKGPMSAEEKRAVIRAEISSAISGRRENVGNFVLLPEPLTPEAGTLTRTMKPRRQVIFERFSKELEQLNRSLR